MVGNIAITLAVNTFIDNPIIISNIMVFIINPVSELDITKALSVLEVKRVFFLNTEVISNA